MASGESPSEMAGGAPKAAGAFRTIGELSQATGLAPHILRYWETRFPQLRPVTRAGSRRYYRPEDVTLVERIDRLLNREGYTIRGVQQLFDREAKGAAPDRAGTPIVSSVELRAIRDMLARALSADTR